MKKLLCPIDFSEASLNALEFAVAIGERENSHLMLLNIFTSSDFNKILDSDHLEQDFEAIQTNAESKLKIIADEIFKVSKKKGLKSCEYAIKPGRIVDELAAIADEEKYEMIIMGTTGHSAYDREYLGGKAESIVQHAHCSVLCVPDNATFHGINKIVYATDYQKEDKVALQQIMAIATVLDSRLEVLHVSHHNDTIDKAMYEDFKNDLSKFIDDDRVEFKRVVFKHVAKGLNDYMHDENGDLLVLLKKRRNFLSALFHRSLTDHLEQFTDYPLLVLKL